MGNKYDEFRNAMSEARHTFNAADSIADDMAYQIKGRLRKVKPFILKELKRELTEFNSHTKQWKS